ncbi:MAG TPA: hypothetical protein VFO70_10130, partial [Chitinophagaceae bacterium]|nr:hypothetical protein [Chitinophagaceae bacterium]
MKNYVLFLLLLLGLHSRAQDSIEAVQRWEYSGYLKDLQWLQFDKNFSGVHYTNLVHNRINLKWMPSEKINGRLEIRNRFYWGDDVNIIPNFKD